MDQLFAQMLQASGGVAYSVVFTPLSVTVTPGVRDSYAGGA
ncbi:hypothetical protein ACFJ1X_004129 [Shigella sonnei]